MGRVIRDTLILPTLNTMLNRIICKIHKHVAVSHTMHTYCVCVHKLHTMHWIHFSPLTACENFPPQNKYSASHSVGFCFPMSKADDMSDEHLGLAIPSNIFIF
jgi:hypothetical protein